MCVCVCMCMSENVSVSDCACVCTCAFVMNACECVYDRGQEQTSVTRVDLVWADEL